MIYLKSFSKIVFFIMLLVLSNSLIIHPAIEIQKKHASHTQEKGSDESRCCFICHPTHHHGIVPQHISQTFNMTSVVDSVKSLQFSLSDSPGRIIFHPPLAI